MSLGLRQLTWTSVAVSAATAALLVASILHRTPWGGIAAAVLLTFYCLLLLLRLRRAEAVIEDQGRALAAGAAALQRAAAERGRTLEQLRQATVAAEAASRSKSRFLANMSHELRTPLNAILGFSEVMHAEVFGPVGNARYRDYLGDIRSSAEHLLGMISELLDLSKAEAGHMEIADETVDIRAVIKQAVAAVRPEAERAGVRLDVELGPVPDLRGDAQRIGQVLAKLLSNAVKFTPSGGRVAVVAQVLSNGELRLTVSDTGVGIPSDQIAKVLEPFGQADNALRGRPSGTGLGLPLARMLVERHGGSLTLSSQSGRGTAVTLTLPSDRVLPNQPARRAV